MMSCVVPEAGGRYRIIAGCLLAVAAAVAMLSPLAQAAKPKAYIETVKTANDTEISFRMVPIPGSLLRQRIALPNEGLVIT